MPARSGFGKKKTNPTETQDININDIIVSANKDIQSDENTEKMISQFIILLYQNNLLHTKQEWILMHQICILQNEDKSSCTHIEDYIECLELKGLGVCKTDLSS